MTISISNLNIDNTAIIGTIVGVLSALNASGTVMPCNFTLTKDSAGFFAISVNKLVTVRAQIPVGNYCVDVFANAQFVPLSGEATFIIAVTST